MILVGPDPLVPPDVAMDSVVLPPAPICRAKDCDATVSRHGELCRRCTEESDAHEEQLRRVLTGEDQAERDLRDATRHLIYMAILGIVVLIAVAVFCTYMGDRAAGSAGITTSAQ